LRFKGIGKINYSTLLRYLDKLRTKTLASGIRRTASFIIIDTKNDNGSRNSFGFSN
jgi:hypothetical protein